MEHREYPEPSAYPEDAVYFDNTRISRFFSCPRAYFFRHVLHWVRPGSTTALAFGAGWHKGLEVIWANAASPLSDMKLLDDASKAFNQIWQDEGFLLESLDITEKRNPGLAREMFAAYLNKYRQQIAGYEVLAIEKPFIVPLAHPVIYYIGRWDKVYKEGNKIYVREHKTTSLYRKEGIFATEWMDSFSPNNQVDGYAYAALGVYGEAFKGVMVEGAMVHKTTRGFTILPIQRSFQNLDAWAFETEYWANEILDNMYTLKEEKQEDKPFLPVFPKRTEHCIHKYGRCEYLDLCKYGLPNPLQMSLPDGWIVNEWDPFAHNMEGNQEPAIIGSGGGNA